MKITDVEAIHTRIEDPAVGIFDGSYDNCVIVVRTDEGVTGIGEVESLAPAIQGIINAPPAHNHARGLKELLIGRDPTNPTDLWNLMYESTDYVGRRGLMMHAIGGIDIALWDIAAQAAGKPIHSLLGGAKRDRVLAYGTIYPLQRTTEEVRQQVRDAQAMNLRAFKLCADPWWIDDLSETARLLNAARAEMGEEATLIVDAALAYRTAAEGLRLLPVIKDVGVYFLEAALPLDDVTGHREMAGHGIPLGVGDLGLTSVAEFDEMMERGGADICQPDITMVGGFTGIRKVAAAALKRGKRVIPHGYKSNITIAANLHFLASHHDEELLEYSTSRSPLRWKTTREQIPVESDGNVRVLDGPGLGVTPDWDFLNSHRWTIRN